MIKITWKSEISSPNTFWAYSGDLCIGWAGQRNDGTYYYDIKAVFTKWITKGHGDVGSIAQGKRSLRRAWVAWCKEAGLESTK